MSYACKDSFAQEKVNRKCIKYIECYLARIFRVAKISRRARVFLSEASFAKNSWGVPDVWVAEWNELEIAAVNAAGLHKRGCRYSALCEAYGDMGHPFVRAIKELFVLWWKLKVLLLDGKDPLLDKLQDA